jgi:predicted N-acetyltransferase YhbS
MLDLRIAFDHETSLNADDRAELRALSEAVFPPDVDAAWPGHNIEWAPAEWWVRIWTKIAPMLVSCARIVLRDATHDGQSVVIGGIGGVKTHPDWRRRGLAAAAVRRAFEFFHAQPAVALALITCEPALIPYYSRLGWREFDGTVLVTQRGLPTAFTFDRIMVHDVRSPAPTTGIIDLRGPPW